MARVSLVVIARDEQAVIGRCLESARHAVDEMIVVDTGSTDRTVMIAQAAGARVVHFRWCDDFAAARNAGADAASGDYLLVLDADECLARRSGTAIRAAVAKGSLGCGLLPLHNAAASDSPVAAVLAGQARRGEPILLPRLVRSDARWQGIVHESIGAWLVQTGASSEPVDAPIVHYGDVDAVRAARGKDSRNLRLLTRRCLLDPEDPVARTYLARELLRVGRREAATEQAERAWTDRLRRQDSDPRLPAVSTATVCAFLRLQAGDYDGGLAVVDKARALADHPNFDLLEAAAVERLAGRDPNQLARARDALLRAVGAHDRRFAEELLPGATSWAAATLLGVVLLREGRPDVALDCFKAATATKADDLGAILGTAEALIELGKANTALATLDPVMSPTLPDGWTLGAAACAALGRWDDLVLFVETAQRAESHGWTHDHRADRLRGLAGLASGAKLLIGAGTPPSHPTNPEQGLQHVQQGEEAWAAGDLATAQAAFTAAVQVAPQLCDAWGNLGVVAHATGQSEDAVALLDIAIALDPDNLEVAHNRAQVLHGIGRTSEAMRALRGILESDPGHSPANASLRDWGVEGHRRPVVLMAVGPRIARTGAIAQIAGFAVRTMWPEVAGAVGGAVAWLRRSQPDLLLLDPDYPDAPALAQASGELGIRVVGPGDLPHDDATALQRLTALHARGRTRQDEGGPPLVSVIVPTYDRARCLQNLLDDLSQQDLDPTLFEVIVVDDGSPRPAAEAVSHADRPYPITMLRQENAGPAKARNTALSHASGPVVVIYNDDAVLPTDNLRRHVIHHLRTVAPEALLGRFDFPESAQAHPFVALMQHSSLLFDYASMEHGKSYDWRMFWTCNLSVPRRCIDAVGGFDEEFGAAICEDVELGLRLQRDQGIRVRYDATLGALHDHDLDIDRYAARQQKLGRYTHLAWTKHGNAWPVGAPGASPHDPAFFLRLRATAEKNAATVARLLPQVRARCAKPLPTDPDARNKVMDGLQSAVRTIGVHEYSIGLIAGQAKLSPARMRARGGLADGLTSIIMPNLNGTPHLQQAVASLRRHTSGPVQLIVVDNGSTDDSVAWLREQSDVTLIQLGENLGAPAARNHGLAIADGDSIVLCDNDVIFTPRWREILLGHLDAWPDIGAVGPMTDYVVGDQKVADPTGCETDLDAYANAYHGARRGQHGYCARLILFFAIYRREVFDRIGGIDTRYGRWGFEDDDLSLRIRRAGYHQRIAQDCFIRHLGSRTASTANLDYQALLLANWEVFKDRWSLDPNLPYGGRWDPGPVLARPWDPTVDVVELPQRERDKLVLLGRGPSRRGDR